MWWLLAEALKFGESPAGLDASIVEAGVPLSHPRARLISPTPASPALKVRVFIVCSPFCVVLLVRPFSQCQQGRSGVTGGGRAAHRWKCLRDVMGAGRTARTHSDTDSGVEPAGRIAARRAAATPGDLEPGTTPEPHATAAENVAAWNGIRNLGGTSGTVIEENHAVRNGFMPSPLTSPPAGRNTAGGIRIASRHGDRRAEESRIPQPSRRPAQRCCGRRHVRARPLRDVVAGRPVRPRSADDGTLTLAGRPIPRAFR